VTIKRKFFIFVGLTQSIIGAFATAFAYMLYHNFLGIQTMLSVSSSDVLLYMLILIVFGLLSIISGLFLVNEQ